MPDPYDIIEHRHRFSAWAAARATQRGFTDVETLRRALEQCGIIEFVETQNLDDTNQESFDLLHRQWCKCIIKYLRGEGVQNITFGRAAKLVAVYLKSFVILGTRLKTQFAHVAHPPIDKILLSKLARSGTCNPAHKTVFETTPWTKLNETEYYDLIEKLRGCLLNKKDPFWKLEEFWTVTR